MEVFLLCVAWRDLLCPLNCCIITRLKYKKMASESLFSETAGFDTGSGSASDIGLAVFGKFVDLATAVLILLVVYILMKWTKRYFSKIETVHEQQKTALNFLERIFNGFLIIIGFTIALKIIGIDISLLVSVGVLGLSYGLTDVIKNYVAGIIIFFKSPFKIGDVVKVKKFIGKIDRMDFQSTGLKTFDNRDVTIYNSDIISESIENYSRLPIRRVEIDVRLGYGTDMDKANVAFENILKSEPAVVSKPKFSVVFKKFSQDGVVVQLRFWVAVPCNMLAIRSSISLKVYQMFDEVNVFSPYTKGIEAALSFAQGSETKSKFKELFAGPLITGKEQPATVPIEVQDQAPDLVDADEPYDV